MNQIFVFANIPVLLQRRNHHILHHLSYLIITLLVLHHIQLHFLLLAYNLLLFDLEGDPVFRPHLNKVAYTLPHEALVLRLKSRVEVVRLGWHESAAVDYVLFLLVDVFKLFGRVADLERFFVAIVKDFLGL